MIPAAGDVSIDVLLPYYGDVSLMQLAVRSVLAQDDTTFRLLVVDDGFPDDSVGPWFDQLDDDRVSYERNPTNLGANGNYRHALTRATADFVVVMGADDLMHRSYIHRVRTLLRRHPDADVVQPGVDVIDEHGDHVSPLGDRIKKRLSPVHHETVVLQGEPLAASLLRGNWTYFPSLCWRRETITAIGFRAGLDVVQDLALLYDVIAAGGILVADPEPVFSYRRHRGSDSSVRALRGSRFDEERAFFRSVVRDCRQRGWGSAARAGSLHLTSRLNALSYLPLALRTRDGAASRALMKHAFLR